MKDVGDTCPRYLDHTPAPVGYIDWHNWAEEKSKTHRQKRCPGCGLWKIWVPKSPKKGGKRK